MTSKKTYTPAEPQEAFPNCPVKINREYRQSATYTQVSTEYQAAWDVEYPLSLDEYQRFAHATSKKTSIGGDLLPYPVLGLAGEAGELANKIKKLYRDSKGFLTETERDELAKELGGVLWYVAEVATVLGLSLRDVGAMNLIQLEDRQRRGVIGGSGDER